MSVLTCIKETTTKLFNSSIPIIRVEHFFKIFDETEMSSKSLSKSAKSTISFDPDTKELTEDSKFPCKTLKIVYFSQDL